MDSGQAILFRDDELPQRPLHDPDAVRARLEAMLSKMRAAASWPWKDVTVRDYRERLWPSLLGKLHDSAGAERIRLALETECARLDATL